MGASEIEDEKKALLEESHQLRKISDILDKWEGFNIAPSASKDTSLWNLFSNNNLLICEFIIQKVADKHNVSDKHANHSCDYKKYIENNLLYASICLFLSPDNEISDPYQRFKRVIENGFGILDFKNEAGLYGWGAIFEKEEEREEHYNNRASLYKICKDFRFAPCGESDPNKRKCASQSFVSDECSEYVGCRVYLEFIWLSICDSNGKIHDPKFILADYIEKNEKEKFENYVKWMQEHTGDCFYFRKPLVKGVRDFDAGEIYLAIKKDGVEESKIEGFAVDVIQVIRDYIGVPLLVRQITLEHEKTKRQKAQLAKSEQMLNLLAEPLESLTGALQKVQENTQTLRSILYDPHRAIFASASGVQKYFIDKNIVMIGNVKWEILHDTPDYMRDKLYKLTSTVSAIIMEILGSSYDAERPSDLFAHAKKLVFDSPSPDPYENLRKMCKQIIGISEDAANKIYLQLFINESGAAFNNSDADHKLLLKALTAFKHTLHYPYKPSEEIKNILPLLVIFFGCDATSVSVDTRIVEDVNSFLSDLTWSTKKITIKPDYFPVPCYSMVLDFISGFLAATKLNITKKEITTAENNIKLTFINDAFDSDSAGKLKIAIENAINVQDRILGGNFHKPFLDLVFNCKACNGSKTIKVSQNDKTVEMTVTVDTMVLLSLKLSNTELTLGFYKET